MRPAQCNETMQDHIEAAAECRIKARVERETPKVDTESLFCRTWDQLNAGKARAVDALLRKHDGHQDHIDGGGHGEHRVHHAAIKHVVARGKQCDRHDRQAELRRVDVLHLLAARRREGGTRFRMIVEVN